MLPETMVPHSPLARTGCRVKRFEGSIVTLLVLALPNAATAQSTAVPSVAATAGPVIHQAQVEARIPFAPHIVTGSDGQTHLAYELRITSFQSDDNPLRLIRLATFTGADTVASSVVEGAGLQRLRNKPAAEGDPIDSLPIASGRTLSLFLWLTLPAGTRTASLRHQLTFVTAKGEIQRADDVRAAVVETPAVRIGPPLRGGRWLAVDGPGNPLSHHWGSPVAINGKLSIPQRFAIDWFGLDDGNHSLRGRHAALTDTVDADWVGYGKDVLAVADGVVVDARDGIANGEPLRPLETPDDLTARTLYGNFVILAIAPGVYAHYAHLRQGSVTMRPGMHVRKGDVIGRLGQTGAAGAPHLHFHISDRSTFEGSEGLPFVIDGFTLYGRESVEDSFDPTIARPLATRPASHTNEMPLDGDILGFR